MYRHLLAGLCCLALPLQLSAAVDVVVTIKPLQLIVESLLGNRGSVSTLIPATNSPHHFTLSPSDRFAIESSDLIIYVGEELETEFDMVMQRMGSDKNVVRLLDITSLAKIDQQGAEVRTADSGSMRLDPHIWLSASNAITIAEEIRSSLIKIDPQGKDQFHENLQRLTSGLTLFQNRWRQQLSVGVDSPYIVYHNAFGYFEHEFGLSHEFALVEDPEIAPGGRQILRIRQSIDEVNPTCLFIDVSANQSTIETMLNDNSIKQVELDLLGVNLSPGQGFEQLLTKLAQDFSNCF